MSITKTAVVGFELGVIKGFENVRSAHIQYVYNLVKYLNGLGHTTHIITNKLRAILFFRKIFLTFHSNLFLILGKERAILFSFQGIVKK